MRIFAPIIGIDPIADGDVAHVLGYFQWAHLVGGVGFLINRIWRPKQNRPNPQAARKKLLGEIEFEPHVASGDVADIRMCEGVVADLMALFIDAAREGGIVLSLNSDQKEC